MHIMAQTISKLRLNLLNLTFCHRIKIDKNSFLPLSTQVTDIQIYHYTVWANKVRIFNQFTYKTDIINDR